MESLALTIQSYPPHATPVDNEGPIVGIVNLVSNLQPTLKQCVEFCVLLLFSDQ